MQTRPLQIPRRSRLTSKALAPSAASQASGNELPRLIRFRHVDAAPELLEERLMRIDVNGCLAGAVQAIADAPRELAVGWAFINGFFELTDAIGQVTACDGRISIMLDGGEDIDRRRVEAVGWLDPRISESGTPIPADRPFTLTERQLLGLVDEAFRQFRADGARAGYVHAAVASADAVHCVARDVHRDLAVAKVIGWTLLEGREHQTDILIVRDVVGVATVRAAVRRGISLVIGGGVPTAPAERIARRAAISIVGMATSPSPGLFGDGGHVIEDDSATDDGDQ